MKKIILASTSLRRKQLLSLLGIEFKSVASDVIEKLNPRFKPRRQTEYLSQQKAYIVSSKYPDCVVIAADTLISLDDDVLGKPKDVKDAHRMLKRLSGRTHKVITGFTILDIHARKEITDSVETTVHFKKLSEREIAIYIKRAKPFDKAGAYGIQDLGALFVERIEGDYHGAMGLPISTLAKELKRFGVTVL